MLLKFRTMSDGRDAGGKLLPDADRMTRVGRLLRATSLDELPQLWNVLHGDISLVGPRPLLMEYLSRYSPQQARRHDVMPGITGWAQINGRNALTWKEKFALDIWYVDNWTMMLDLRIVMLTFMRVLKRDGISRAGHVTMPEFMGANVAAPLKSRDRDVGVKMNLCIYCSGGFGKEVLDIARRLNRAHSLWDRIVFLDDMREESSFYGADVFRLEAARERFGAAAMQAVIANGEPFVRKALLEKLDKAGIDTASLVDDRAVISETATIGAGAIIFPGCFVSSMAVIGRNIAIIAGSTIGHDTVFGDNCMVSGQVNIGGGCSIGSESYLGMGAQVKEHTRIGRAAIVGMGSIVFADIPDEVIALGNPCRPMRPNINKRIFG